MKRIFIIILIFLAAKTFAQYEKENSNFTYAGVGYSLVFFTHPAVSNIYPTLDFGSSSFLSEINPYFGFKINKNIALEISPSFIFSSSYEEKEGYDYKIENRNYWYVPQRATLFALILNAKVKHFPFADKENSILNNFYIGFGAGAYFAKEKYESFLYDNKTNLNYLASRNDQNSVWTGDIQFSVGFASNSAFGYGFDITYRYVPMPIKRNTPLSTSNASNFNSINLSLGAMFSFY